jgi:hypothetical protein
VFDGGVKEVKEKEEKVYDASLEMIKGVTNFVKNKNMKNQSSTDKEVNISNVSGEMIEREISEERMRNVSDPNLELTEKVSVKAGEDKICANKNSNGSGISINAGQTNGKRHQSKSLIQYNKKSNEDNFNY